MIRPARFLAGSRKPERVVRRAAAEVAQDTAAQPQAEQPVEAGADQTSTSYDDSDLVFEVPEWVLKRNKEFADEIKGKLILAPLTKVRQSPC